MAKGHCFKPPTNHNRPYILHSISSIYLGIPLVIIGVVSNIICMLLWKRLMKRSRNRNISCGIYLITISVVDTGMLFTFFLCETMFYLHPTITESNSYNVFFAYLGYPSYMFFTFLSFWLIAGVDTCRLTMVLFPIKLRQSATRITNTVIVLIITFVFGVNIPNFLAYEASYTTEGVPCRWETDLYQTSSFFNYSFWFQCVFLTTIPWTIIVIVNIIMLVHDALVPNYTPKSQRRAGEMGNLLFSVSLWFVSVIFWQCVAQCFFLKTPRNSASWNDIDSSFAFAKLGMVLNSSTKLILFFLTSRTFRKAFIHLFVSPKTIYAHITRRSSITKGTSQQRKQRKTKSNSVFGRSINAVMNTPQDSATKYTPQSIISNKVVLHKLFSAHEVSGNQIEIELRPI